jgi:hypothetical protein
MLRSDVPRQEATDRLPVYRQIIGPTAMECAASTAFVQEVAAAVAAVAEKFGQSIALDMLYLYALKRPIDGGGLLYRLQRLQAPGDTLFQHVAEVFDSDEFQKTNATGYLAPVAVLTAWCGTSGLPAAP